MSRKTVIIRKKRQQRQRPKRHPKSIFDLPDDDEFGVSVELLSFRRLQRLRKRRLQLTKQRYRFFGWSRASKQTVIPMGTFHSHAAMKEFFFGRNNDGGEV